MFLNEGIITKTLELRNINVLLYGDNIQYLYNLIHNNKFKKCNSYNIDYLTYQDIYYISIKKSCKLNLLELLKEICISPNYYNNIVQKKVIILINLHELNSTYQQSIKTIIDNSYLSCIFIIHTDTLNLIDRNIVDRFIVFSLPTMTKKDDTILITYNRIIKLLKQNKLNKTVIETIREMAYMYYMNHTHSTDLQRLFVEKIGLNLYIPNSVKYKVVEDMCRINNLYQHSYRKPIFLEFIIISLYKHLENYTYNL